jgi:hypothetical protein
MTEIGGCPPSSKTIREKEVNAMTYSTPELVVLGPAHVLVLGGLIGQGDNCVSERSRLPVGLTLGLDD